MNPRGSEKTERSSKRREGNEPSRVPSMSLPEGGGALRGMGEKLAANPVTGTGSRRPIIGVRPLICEGSFNWCKQTPFLLAQQICVAG